MKEILNQTQLSCEGGTQVKLSCVAYTCQLVWFS